MRILFVDDDRTICELFQLAFGMEGVIGHFAHDGAQAVEAIASPMYRFDAVVLDMEMPVMDGWEALKRIRELPQGKDLPIVMFTGYTGIDLRARALECGANELLHKPLLAGPLLRLLYSLVEVPLQRPHDT